MTPKSAGKIASKLFIKNLNIAIACDVASCCIMLLQRDPTIPERSIKRGSNFVCWMELYWRKTYDCWRNCRRSQEKNGKATQSQIQNTHSSLPSSAPNKAVLILWEPFEASYLSHLFAIPPHPANKTLYFAMLSSFMAISFQTGLRASTKMGQNPPILFSPQPVFNRNHYNQAIY